MSSNDFAVTFAIRWTGTAAITVGHRVENNSAFPLPRPFLDARDRQRASTEPGRMEMTVNRNHRRRMARMPVVAVLVASSVVLAVAARAGECPADKRLANATAPVTKAAKGVTDKVLASIDLSKEKAALADHQLRLRKLEIEPGGIFPWHSHGDRPAIIYVITGKIYEYASDCAVPILHRAGEVSREAGGTQHWWQNTGSETVVLLSADVLHDASDQNM
jgi:quercetin dioxygenase-like cupin family protein